MVLSGQALEITKFGREDRDAEVDQNNPACRRRCGCARLGIVASRSGREWPIVGIRLTVDVHHDTREERGMRRYPNASEGR